MSSKTNKEHTYKVLFHNQGQIFEVYAKNIYQSDLYGFPRLVGTHYLPTDSVHDTLADYGVYRRIDAQADWVVARSRGDYITEDWAYQHLIDSDILRNMGDWSDGTKASPLLIYQDALNTESKFQYCKTFEGKL